MQLIKITSTNQSTTASVVTENHDSEDAHTLDSIVIREIGNLSLENTQTTESDDDLAMISVTLALTIL